MRNRKFATGFGCSFWIFAACAVAVSVVLTYAIITSDLPDWAKYLLLK